MLAFAIYSMYYVHENTYATNVIFHQPRYSGIIVGLPRQVQSNLVAAAHKSSKLGSQGVVDISNNVQPVKWKSFRRHEGQRSRGNIVEIIVK